MDLDICQGISSQDSPVVEDISMRSINRLGHVTPGPGSRLETLEPRGGQFIQRAKDNTKTGGEAAESSDGSIPLDRVILVATLSPETGNPSCIVESSHAG